MSEERRDKLEGIGFEWRVRSKKEAAPLRTPA